MSIVLLSLPFVSLSNLAAAGVRRTVLRPSTVFSKAPNRTPRLCRPVSEESHVSVSHAWRARSTDRQTVGHGANNYQATGQAAKGEEPVTGRVRHHHHDGDPRRPSLPCSSVAGRRVRGEITYFSVDAWTQIASLGDDRQSVKKPERRSTREPVASRSVCE